MIRADDRLSQAEIARRAGVDKKFIGAVENRRANPTTTHLVRLAQGLGLAGVAELMSKAEDTARRIADATIQPTE
jgi:transcriptional regulator with XRE-family HTH domain